MSRRIRIAMLGLFTIMGLMAGVALVPDGRVSQNFREGAVFVLAMLANAFYWYGTEAGAEEKQP